MLAFPVGAFPGIGSAYVAPASDPALRRVIMDLSIAITGQVESVAGRKAKAALKFQDDDGVLHTGPVAFVGTQTIWTGSKTVTSDAEGVASFDLIPTSAMTVPGGLKAVYEFSVDGKVAKIVSLPSGDMSPITLDRLS